VPAENIIGEPFGRDTAAACALGTAIAQVRDPDAIVAVLTADHVIHDTQAFLAALAESLDVAASQDVLITLGIQPASPRTGLGYIEGGDPIEHDGDVAFVSARRFVEKPDRVTAEEYVRSGAFFWNSGMFVWKASAFEKTLAEHRPQLEALMKAVRPAVGTREFSSCLRTEYDKLEKISVDYAVMEKADNIVMAKGVFDWDDVGAWPSLETHFKPDALENVMIGKAESLESERNVVVSGSRLTALVGVKDLVVVQAEGATLVCSKDCAEDVKKMVRHLAEKGTYDDLL
jgi:mannose-1-phosphate guanylyltransferase